jgi:hypothetical protein
MGDEAMEARVTDLWPLAGRQSNLIDEKPVTDVFRWTL